MSPFPQEVTFQTRLPYDSLPTAASAHFAPGQRRHYLQAQWKDLIDQPSCEFQVVHLMSQTERHKFLGSIAGIADIVYQQAEVNVEFQKDEVYFKRLTTVIDHAIAELQDTYLHETKRPGGKYLNEVHQCMQSTRMPVSNRIHPQTASSSSHCRQTCNQKQPDADLPAHSIDEEFGYEIRKGLVKKSSLLVKRLSVELHDILY